MLVEDAYGASLFLSDEAMVIIIEVAQANEKSPEKAIKSGVAFQAAGSISE